jgi:hypothetical protein
MATTHRKWLMIVALVLGAIAVVIAGTGCSVFGLRAATATPPVTRGATATVTPASAITATPSARPTKPVIAIPKDQATCLAQGGRWERIGIAPYEQCNLPRARCRARVQRFERVCRLVSCQFVARGARACSTPGDAHPGRAASVLIGSSWSVALPLSKTVR